MTQSPTPPLLEVRNVSKRFRLRDGTMVNAVNNVSFTLEAGQIMSLVGESGSGKSTLARLILGLVRPDEGEILIKGQRIDTLSPRQMAPFRRIMQPVFQDPANAFNPRRMVYDSIMQAVAQTPHDAAPDVVIERVLDQVRLSPGRRFFDRFPHELSGGQRQRLGIARALAMNPEFIIMDEPLSGADVSIRGQVLNLLLDLRDATGMAYVFITHDMAVAHSFAQHVLVMLKGDLIEQGPAEDMFLNPRHAYTRLLIDSGRLELPTAPDHQP